MDWRHPQQVQGYVTGIGVLQAVGETACNQIGLLALAQCFQRAGLRCRGEAERLCCG